MTITRCRGANEGPHPRLRADAASRDLSMAIRAASVERLTREIPDDALVLDVGGWITPFTRADWVIDLMPYETRGTHGRQGDGPERFGADTWVQRDICDREPWPFDDDQFDFVL